MILYLITLSCHTLPPCGRFSPGAQLRGLFNEGEGSKSTSSRNIKRVFRILGSFSGSPELKSQGMRIKRGGWTKDREFSPEVIIHS